MSMYEIPNMTTGIDNTLVEVATQVPSFIWGFLVFIWGVVFLGGMNAQSKRFGYSDLPQWALLASISTTLVSLLLSIKGGLINLEVLAITISVTLLTGFWYFLSKGPREI